MFLGSVLRNNKHSTFWTAKRARQKKIIGEIYKFDEMCQQGQQGQATNSSIVHYVEPIPYNKFIGCSWGKLCAWKTYKTTTGTSFKKTIWLQPWFHKQGQPRKWSTLVANSD